MLHDIVLALGGVGGAVLKSILNEEVISLSFAIHPCEKNILAQIINIGDNYKTIQNFLKKIPHFGEELIILDNGFEITPGMYLRAFCNGVFDCLEPYRKNLMKLEAEILQNPYHTVSNILAQVSVFTPLLTTLNSVINQIVARQLHGCKILHLLHQHLSSGIRMVDDAMASIMRCCHQVMLKQLSSFLLYGQLIDPHKEFFIEEFLLVRESHHSSNTTLDSESQPDTSMKSEVINVIVKTCAQKELTSDSNSVPEYKVVQDMVPCYIPLSVSEKTKFIGSTVVLFSRDPRGRKSGLDIKKYYSVYDKMESSLLNQLKSLQNASVLDISLLESVVDNIQLCVTQHLFSLAKDEANLMGELQLIKDYFLLGRGELFVVFLRKASGLLLKPVTSNNTSRDLDNYLYLSVQNVHLNSDVITEKFSFKVPLKNQVPPDSTVWKEMVLQYNVPWPLHMLFIPKVLHTYNRLFNFLLQVKMTELNLHDVWIENVKRKDNVISEILKIVWIDDRLPPEVWTLRNTLQFLIGNLQCYLQLDVVESRFTRLRNALEKTKDFQQVVHLHSIFLSDVANESFVDTHHPLEDRPIKRHPVNLCLMHILCLCDDFCAEVAKDEINVKVIEKITSDLDMNIAMLMNLITVLGNKAAALRLLWLRLDYNRYFSARI